MTLSDRRPSLSGVVRTEDGAPAADGFVVVFSADRALWRSGSRRIRAVRPATDGHYHVRDLPPGDYLIAALTDAEPDEWYDGAFLDHLAAGAVRVTVAEGEQKTQDIRMSGSRP